MAIGVVYDLLNLKSTREVHVTDKEELSGKDEIKIPG